MNQSEFVATLDANNPFVQEFAVFIRGSLAKDLIAYPKGPDLTERVQELCQKELYPLVDKKLQMVIGVPEGAHQNMRWLMYLYHDAYLNPDAPKPRPDLAASWYVMDGLGYYISSEHPDIIFVGGQYQPDQFDNALFASMTLSR